MMQRLRSTLLKVDPTKSEDFELPDGEVIHTLPVALPATLAGQQQLGLLVLQYVPDAPDDDAAHRRDLERDFPRCAPR